MLGELTRRRVVQGGAALAVLPGAGAAPFSAEVVREAARRLAGAAYRAPDDVLPEGTTYDQYSSIQPRDDRRLWHGLGLGFEVGFYPRGWLFRSRVDMYEVVEGVASAVAYDPALFDNADAGVRVDDLGFAGFRVHNAINRADKLDEVLVFLGASYFRAVAKGQAWGLSARGLALGTGRPEPEEFPGFRAFWLERPVAGAALVIHALLDSRSVAGAFRFSVRAGTETVMEVESVLYPRVDIADWGVAPLTSMYLFGPGDRGARDDWRTAVHDSEGLAMVTGGGEHLWRPLQNPAALQYSGFGDAGTRGFGLMQRRRGFADYGEVGMQYRRRPSLWVEPMGDWGEGMVGLVEIPTADETNDNIVAFWRGREALRAGGRYGFAYRLRWGTGAPAAGLGWVQSTRVGPGPSGRRFVLDYAGGRLGALGEELVWVEAWCSAGRVGVAYSEANAETGGWRVELDFGAGGARVSELRCVLMGEGGVLAETWLWRWMA